jgi:hypothetical protein
MKYLVRAVLFAVILTVGLDSEQGFADWQCNPTYHICWGIIINFQGSNETVCAAENYSSQTYTLDFVVCRRSCGTARPTLAPNVFNPFFAWPAVVRSPFGASGSPKVSCTPHWPPRKHNE